MGTASAVAIVSRELNMLTMAKGGTQSPKPLRATATLAWLRCMKTAAIASARSPATLVPCVRDLGGAWAVAKVVV